MYYHIHTNYSTPFRYFIIAFSSVHISKLLRGLDFHGHVLIYHLVADQQGRPAGV